MENSLPSNNGELHNSRADREGILRPGSACGGGGVRGEVRHQASQHHQHDADGAAEGKFYVIGLIDIRYRFCLSLSTIMDTSNHLFVSTGPSRSGIAV